MSPHPTEALADDRPLFILGSVRSGTTLTRDLLRRVPGFICPEETHFFRWSEPFRTPQSLAPLRNNPVLRQHREMDRVTEEEFRAMLLTSRTRAELQRRYVAAFAKAQGITGAYRWFDKTPQNVYGAALIAQALPRARFLHLVRNPLNVVASMKLGRQVRVSDRIGATNYWIEAVQIMTTLSEACPDRVLTLRYEDLVEDIPGAMARILGHAGVDAPAGLFRRGDAHAERNLWHGALSLDEARSVRNLCGSLARKQGYDLDAEIAALAGSSA